jgi:hypothetical protein
MKLLIATLLFGISTQAFAGPTSSGGIGGLVKVKLCTSSVDSGNKVQITTYENGQSAASYYQGESATFIACKVPASSRRPLAEKTLFSCLEKRAGEGLAKIVVVQNSQGAQIAGAYRQDIVGKFILEDSFICEDVL